MRSEVDRMRISAVKTLEAAGYTYEGGQLWKPPLGNYPGPLMARIDELEAENRRLREALEKIAAPTFGTELWNTHKERAEIYRTHLTSIQTIARAALSQEEKPCD